MKFTFKKNDEKLKKLKRGMIKVSSLKKLSRDPVGLDKVPDHLADWSLFSPVGLPKLTHDLMSRIENARLSGPERLDYILFPLNKEGLPHNEDLLFQILVSPGLKGKIKASEGYKYGRLDPSLLEGLASSSVGVLGEGSLQALSPENLCQLPNANTDRKREKAMFVSFTKSISAKVDQRDDDPILNKWRLSLPATLKHIIWVAVDVSTTGGIQKRLRKTVAAAAERSVDHMLFTAINSKNAKIENMYSCDKDEALMLAKLRALSVYETAVVIPNNAVRRFSKEMQAELTRFPLIYMASGQMAFMLQDSNILADLEYVNSFKVSASLALSQMDIDFQRQLGLHGQNLFFNPIDEKVKKREIDLKSSFVSYIGRIDFHAKNAVVLLDVAEEMQRRNLGPLRICTTANPKNSPDYEAFIKEMEHRGLNEALIFVLEETDTEKLYSDTSLLLLPSKKEAFGNVILEAFSFGIPVISTAFAPGPAQIITDGYTGLLLDSLDPEKVCDRIQGLIEDPALYDEMSNASFEEHKLYSFENYFERMESICLKTLKSFNGINHLSVFPQLKMVKGFDARLEKNNLRMEKLNSSRIQLVESNKRFKARIETMKSNSKVKSERIERLNVRIDTLKNNSKIKSSMIDSLKAKLDKA